jgi:Peptidase of plants and bacteria
MTATLSATPSATPSPLPVLTKRSPDGNPSTTKKPSLPKPKLRLNLHDARHPAAASFFSFIPDLEAVLEAALTAIIDQLYTSPHRQTTHQKTAPLPPFNPSIPLTRSVTVILQNFDGVAYTNGTELDDDHKEIHFSLSYINHVCNNNADPFAELKGVLTHELVHCYQHTAPPASQGSSIARPPGGLIEGIADFVRLKAGLAAPHWQVPKSALDRASNWDAGYQHTAYFLAWLEDERIGRGAIGLLNDRLLRTGYIGEAHEGEADKSQPSFWRDLFGLEVAGLWEEYGRYLDEGAEKE